jgi:predicted nucleotidyltransferase
MEPTQFSELNNVLRELVAQVQAILDEKCVAIYLQGSFAVGDADEHSDVDFLVGVSAQLEQAEIHQLQAMHERFVDSGIHWAMHLEGSYIPLHALRRFTAPKQKFWYVDNGSRVLEESDHDDTQVVRWSTREHGIVLAGPPPSQLIDPVSADDLRAEVKDTICWWGNHLLDDPTHWTSRWYVTFVVIMYCRMLQTLETGTVESKRSAAAWALQTLNDRWHGLIRSAWADRPEPWRKVHSEAALSEHQEAQEFVRFALQQIEER